MEDPPTSSDDESVDIEDTASAEESQATGNQVTDESFDSAEQESQSDASRSLGSEDTWSETESESVNSANESSFKRPRLEVDQAQEQADGQGQEQADGQGQEQAQGPQRRMRPQGHHQDTGLHRRPQGRNDPSDALARNYELATSGDSQRVLDHNPTAARDHALQYSGIPQISQLCEQSGLRSLHTDSLAFHRNDVTCVFVGNYAPTTHEEVFEDRLLWTRDDGQLGECWRHRVSILCCMLEGEHGMQHDGMCIIPFGSYMCIDEIYF